MNSPRIALVLGAGGVAGHAFHAGLLAALSRETGWDPRDADLVVGTSAGSVVGLALRAGLSADDLYARALDDPLSPAGRRLLAPLPPPTDGWGIAPGPRSRFPVPSSPGLLARAAMRPWSVRPGVALAGLAPRGRFDVSRIALDTDLLVESLDRPVTGLWITAVRLRDGRPVVFGRGTQDAAPPAEWTWGQAVAASCAIPGFFAPVEIQGEPFIDGGAHSPTHAALASEVAPDLVIVSSPMSAVRATPGLRVDAPIRAMYRWRLAAEVGRLRRAKIPVMVFQPTAEVLTAAGLNAMSDRVRAPVAQATFAAVTARCRRADFIDGAGLLVA